MALGLRSVAEAQQCISAREFAEWIAYDSISPIGPERQEWALAMLASVFANAFRSSKQRPFVVKDFMPQWDRPKRDAKQLEDMMLAAFRLHNTGQKQQNNDGNENNRAARS